LFQRILLIGDGSAARTAFGCYLFRVAYKLARIHPILSSFNDLGCWRLVVKVCAPEAGGDLNPDYFKDPAVLGQFRAIFEPRWDAAIDAVEKRTSVINQIRA